MFDYKILIGIAVALLLIVGPLVLAVWGLNASRQASGAAAEAARAWNWKLTIVSGLLYALACY